MAVLSEGISKELYQEERYALQTDLWHLANVLYPPPKYRWGVSAHKPICDKFFLKKDPKRALREQGGYHQRIYIDPRNHYKTTVDICDIVQWILCFPDVRILIASGTRDHAISMLRAAKSHFQYNEVIRYFFPEWCPQAHKAEDFGTSDAFTCPARKDRELREPTCAVASPDSAVASQHYDVLKFDDLVNETNSKTKESLSNVTNWFKQTNPLLEPYGYRDVIGTIYSFDDLHSEILGEDLQQEDQLVAKPHAREKHSMWLVTKRSCYISDNEPLFPERCGTKEQTIEWLEKERYELGSYLFSHHYMNRPVPGDSQFFPWPVVDKAIISRKELPQNRTFFTTLDLAISQSKEADNTAIVTCSIGRYDKETTIFVEDIVWGKTKPQDVVNALFEVYKKFHPMQIRSEKVGFTILLDPLVKAESQRRNVFLPLVWVPRDTRQNKEGRISAMQPFFERGQIKIVSDCPNKEQLMSELVRFPKYKRDDVVDALADHLEFLAMFQQGPANVPLPELTTLCGNERLGLMA